MDGCMVERINGWMKGWSDGWTGEWMDGCMDKLLDGCMKGGGHLQKVSGLPSLPAHFALFWGTLACEARINPVELLLLYDHADALCTCSCYSLVYFFFTCFLQPSRCWRVQLTIGWQSYTAGLHNVACHSTCSLPLQSLRYKALRSKCTTAAPDPRRRLCCMSAFVPFGL